VTKGKNEKSGKTKGMISKGHSLKPTSIMLLLSFLLPSTIPLQSDVHDKAAVGVVVKERLLHAMQDHTKSSCQARATHGGEELPVGKNSSWAWFMQRGEELHGWV
jgi:predicted transcriptional regulator